MLQDTLSKEIAQEYELLNPEGVVNHRKMEVNPHPASLEDKLVVLRANGKHNSDSTLERIAELMRDGVQGIQLIRAWEVLPETNAISQTVERSKLWAEKIAALKPDLVIGSSGDCGSCTSWLVIDQLNLERLGVPTVTVVTDQFERLAKSTALSQGVSDAPFVVFSHPIGMIPLDAIRKKTESMFPDVMKAATNQRKSTAKSTVDKSVYPAERIKYTGRARDLSRFFFEKGWSMGLPIMPPTADAVEEILQGTTRRADEVIGVVPPRMGTLTVEMVAVHAAMAGCKPEYMPLLIAAMEALLNPQTNWQGAATTTGTTAVLAIVNGPVVKEIGLAYDQGAAGKGHHANAALGYAINSIAYTIGGSKPPEVDKGTLSAPSDFTGWIFGENEDALPEGWRPYHVEKGFQETDSVVTVMVTYPPVENIDHWSLNTTEQMRWWAYLISPMINMGGPCVPLVLAQPFIIGLGPEHAQMLAASGWTKAMFGQAFWEQTRIPLSAWPAGCTVGILEERLGKQLTPESMIPVTTSPDLLEVVIAGGAGKQSHYFAPFPGGYPVSKLIRK